MAFLHGCHLLQGRELLNGPMFSECGDLAGLSDLCLDPVLERFEITGVCPGPRAWVPSLLQFGPRAQAAGGLALPAEVRS